MTEIQIGDLFEKLHKKLIVLIQVRLYEGCPKDYAYDCLDEVFSIALEKQNDPKFNANPESWLYKTAENVVSNFNRKSAIRLSYHQTTNDISEVIDPSDMTEHIAYKIAVEDHIFDIIRQNLTREERVLYIMRYKQNMDLDTMAKELYMKKGPLKTRLSRLKSKITKLVHQHVGENETPLH